MENILEKEGSLLVHDRNSNDIIDENFTPLNPSNINLAANGLWLENP